DPFACDMSSIRGVSRSRRIEMKTTHLVATLALSTLTSILPFGGCNAIDSSSKETAGKSREPEAINAKVNDIPSFIQCLKAKQKANGGKLNNIADTVSCIPDKCEITLIMSSSAQTACTFKGKNGDCKMPRVLLKCGKAKPFFFPSYILCPAYVGGGRGSPNDIELGTQLG